jgi:hypothetical protein
MQIQILPRGADPNSFQTFKKIDADGFRPENGRSSNGWHDSHQTSRLGQVILKTSLMRMNKCRRCTDLVAILFRKGCEAFRYLLYNPETGEILTRTPLSWFKVGLI